MMMLSADSTDSLFLLSVMVFPAAEKVSSEGTVEAIIAK